MSFLLDLIFGKSEAAPVVPVPATPITDDVAWTFAALVGGASVEIYRRDDGLFYYQELRHDRVVNPVWGDHEETYAVSKSGLFGSVEDARRAAESELHWMNIGTS